ncbi:hypothetical protein H6G89_07470 [Oscillatoria sp. FACHB-1407]|uniref:DUF6658 family protein n=1 Tax=Oscillatoria sp. FACHB-1407 TaxID=2692847 RepID=UPI001683953E|nr:DUF6658 family protein [Oscillatoria sp. FACHB-1407]MBD2460881.1 hypothetical protein [Oscillatoria sp. FACHB-1407]
MSRLVSFFKSLKLRQIVSIVVVGVALLFSTACNNGNLQGARPEVPPVQMGGNNNPHSMGGDGYTEYKMSTDPQVKPSGSNLRSSLFDFNQLVASNSTDIKSNASDILYPGSSTSSTTKPDIGPRGAALEPEPIRGERQRVINRSNPDEQILEKIGQQFEDSSEFLKENFDFTLEQAGEDRDINAAK